MGGYDEIVNFCLVCQFSTTGYREEKEHSLAMPGAVPIPSFLLSMAISVVGGEIRERAEFDFDGLAPVEEAPFAVAPVLFGVATDDNFILAHHTYDNYKAWGGTDKLACGSIFPAKARSTKVDRHA